MACSSEVKGPLSTMSVDNVPVNATTTSTTTFPKSEHRPGHAQEDVQRHVATATADLIRPLGHGQRREDRAGHDRAQDQADLG